MIVDSSVLIAVLRGEPDREQLLRALLDADVCRVSAATYLESAIVIDGSRDPVLQRDFDELLAISRCRIELVPASRPGSRARRTVISVRGPAIPPS